MSRLALIAAALVVLGSPAVADERTPATAAAPIPAGAAERAQYDRADPLTRSVFWGRQNEINPSDPVAGVKAAQALRELGQFDQAATLAQSVLLTQPSNVEAMLEVGRAHIARG